MSPKTIINPNDHLSNLDMKNVYTTSSFPGFLNPLLKKAMQLNSKIIALLIICLLSSVSLFAIPPSAIKYVKPAATGTGDGSSWANASADLQGMIDASNEYEQVWVAAGTYKPLREPTNTAADNLNGSNRNYAYVLKDKVKVYGGFVGTETTLLERTDAVILANPSILSGANASPSTSDDLYHVVISVNDDANTVLNGFTIQNGKADGGSGNIIVETSADPINPYKIVKNHGGGLHIYESNPTIEKCIFQSSIAKNYGGGIYNYKSSPAITSCVFISNSTIDLYGGGIYNAEASNPYIYNCTFTSNSSIYGGAIYNSSEVNPRIEKCIFISNSATLSGGGIYTANASPDIVNCVFDANTAIYYGAGIYNSVSSSRIINCLFNNNSAVSGGGVYNSDAPSSIINCTFYKNNAGLTGFGGAIYNTNVNSDVKIQNSIFKENKRANAFAAGADIKNENEAKVTVSNTLLQFQNNSTNYPGLASISGFQGAGTGNFYTTDPFFVTASNPIGSDNKWGTADDGLRLQNCSPILNVGNNSFNPTGTYAFDLSGINLRINPTYTPLNVDLGAYENEFGAMLVGISRNPNTPTPHPYVCVRETTTFTASPAYPGLFPMYEFFLNNVSVQSGVNSTYTLNSLVNADQIRVTLTSQACTAKSDTITMVVHAPVLVTQTNSPVCAEQTLTFTSENSVSNIGNSYLWTGPGFNLPNTSQSPEFINATVGLSGKYFLKVTDTYGCITRDTLDLLVNPLPIPLTANTSDTSFVCVGQPLKFSSTNTGVSVNNFFQWTGNAFTSTGTDQNPVFLYATEAMSGKHYVTIEDNNGCKQIDSTVVLVNSIPVPSASDNTPVCAGQIIEFFSEDTRTVPPLPLIFAWSGPASYSSAISNPQIDSAAMNMNGVYKVIIEDAKGCKDSTTTTVVVRSLPIPVQTYNNPVCAEDSIFLFSTDTRDPNFPTYDYTWRGPKAFGSSLQNPKIPESTVDMSGEYFLTMTDVFGCVDSSKFDVLVHSLPIPKLSYNPHVCQEDTLKLNIIDLRTTQEPTYSYAWEGPLGFDTTAQGFSIPNSVVNMTGMYYVNVTDQYGCAEFDSIDVIVNSLPIPSANSNSPVCSAETLNLYTSDTRNPNAASYTYSWTGPNSYSSELQNPIFNSVDVSLSGIYEITITDNFGCSGSSSTEVVNHHPKATAVNDGPYDEGDNVNLLATGGTRFDWQGPNGFTSNLVNPSFPDGKPANSGIYSVTVTYQF